MSVRKLLAKYIYFPIINIRSQTGKNIKRMGKSQWLSSDEIKELQWDKLKRLLSYSYQNIPYYRGLLDSLNINLSDIKSLEGLQVIPPLSKKNIKENFHKMIAVTTDRRKLIQRTTSGSTGEPVTIFRDRRADSIVSATGWRSRRWGGHDIGDKYARIWGYTFNNDPVKKFYLKSKIKQTIGDLIEPVEKLNAFETISVSAMEDFFQKIRRKKIRFLIGYTNSVYFFAQFVNRHHQGEIKLQSVRTISEMLHNYQRKLIEKEFGCKVFNTYGNRENGLIAAECSYHEGFHINAENLYVEILDKKGKQVPRGEIGEIAITDLNNYAMPLIRYLIGDLGSLSPKICSCGRGLPLMEKIVGRDVDMLTSSDGNLLDGFILCAFLHERLVDEIDRYRVVQNVKGEADIYLKLLRPLNEDGFEQLKTDLLNLINNKLSIQFHIVDELPFHESGKYKFIISNVNG